MKRRWEPGTQTNPRDAKGSARSFGSHCQAEMHTCGRNGGPVPWAEAVAQVPAPVPANSRKERVVVAVLPLRGPGLALL